MPRAIFINPPVADVARSTAFYEVIGFNKNPAFSNAQASAMGWSDTIHVSCPGHAFYATFTDKQICDAQRQSSALLCLSFDSKDAVDDTHDSAAAAGGRDHRTIEDKGFIYGGAFDDPDGHGWETIWMGAAAATENATNAQGAA